MAAYDVENFNALFQFIPAARAALDDNRWDYLIGGGGTETTLLRNRQALDGWAFRPRVLQDVSRITAAGTFFGKPTRLPVALAPIGVLHHFHAEGAVGAARAAADFGIGTFANVLDEPGLETLAQASTGPKVFQLYVRGGDAWVDAVAERAIAAGYDAFCLTVDLALKGRRERDIAKRYVASSKDASFLASLNWSDVERFKRRHDIPLVIKGIATAEDAQRALDLGVEGIYVSNHGGRQLDHGRGSLDVLPEIVDTVRGRAQVIVDGGFSRGTDIVKAIALGADLVCIGRLYAYGLAAGGATGVSRVLELLELEVVETLGLLGVTDFTQLDQSYLHRALPVYAPHVFSAFPLLEGGAGYGSQKA